MVANLFNERFYSYRMPAWHGLGIVSEEEMGAVEAFSALSPYDIELRDLFLKETRGTKNHYNPIGNRAIVRTAVPDDPEERLFGIVGSEYTLVTPTEVCEIYDAKVGQPVETIGALGTGETLFLTTKLPSYDIAGDAVDNYLLVVSPYTGLASIEIRVTPVKVVCQNTLIAAKHASTEAYKIIHDSTAKERMEEWMEGLYGRALQRATTMQQAFDMFASFQPSAGQVQSIIEATYSYPSLLNNTAPADVMERRAKDRAYWIRTADRNRTAVMELFEGKGKGSQTPAARGTGWGLYNAVVEWEDYRQPAKLTQDESRLVQSLFGVRAAVKENAFAQVEIALKSK